MATGGVPVAVNVSSTRVQEDFSTIFGPLKIGQERVLEDYYCSLGTSSPMNGGRLYITANHICFHSNIIRKTLKVMRFADVADIKKSGGGLLSTGSLDLVMRDGKVHSLCSLVSRDAAYETLRQLLDYTRRVAVANSERSKAQKTADSRPRRAAVGTVRRRRARSRSYSSSSDGSSGSSYSYSSGSEDESSRSYSSSSASASDHSGEEDEAVPSSVAADSTPTEEKTESTDPLGPERKERVRSRSLSPAPATGTGTSGPNHADTASSSAEGHSSLMSSNSAAAPTKEATVSASMPVLEHVTKAASHSVSMESGEEKEKPGNADKEEKDKEKEEKDKSDGEGRNEHSVLSLSAPNLNQALRSKQLLPPAATDTCQHAKSPAKPTPIVSTKVPNVTLEVFFIKFLADDSKFTDELHTRLGYTEQAVEPWALESTGCCLKRIVKFRIALNSSFGPKSTAVVQTQRALLSAPKQMVVTTSSASLDVPYSDAFTVDTYWVIKQEDLPGTPPSVSLVVQACVPFSRSVMLRGVIERSALEGARSYFPVWAERATEEASKFKPLPPVPTPTKSAAAVSKSSLAKTAASSKTPSGKGGAGHRSSSSSKRHRSRSPSSRGHHRSSRHRSSHHRSSSGHKPASSAAAALPVQSTMQPLAMGADSADPSFLEPYMALIPGGVPLVAAVAWALALLALASLTLVGLPWLWMTSSAASQALQDAALTRSAMLDLARQMSAAQALELQQLRSRLSSGSPPLAVGEDAPDDAFAVLLAEFLRSQGARGRDACAVLENPLWLEEERARELEASGYSWFFWISILGGLGSVAAGLLYYFKSFLL